MISEESRPILEIAIDVAERGLQAFCRYITANDTGATGGHQAGFYIGKQARNILFSEQPRKGENKEKWINIKWQNDFTTQSRIIYYGRGTRNEYRITRFGQDFPYLRDEYIGSLLVLVKREEYDYEGFILDKDAEIEYFFDYFNLSQHNTNQLIHPAPIDLMANKSLLNCFQKHLEQWQTEMPDTNTMALLARKCYNDIFAVSINNIRTNPDRIIMGWLDSEYTLFKAFEEHIYQPIYTKPFKSCQALIDFANTILNRRKARAGKSLELHLAALFDASNIPYTSQARTEGNKHPDFIFPSGDAYQDMQFPSKRLLFLGAKRTCKDRWRQVINEAERIKIKYLFTLQNGISSNQLKEMKKRE